ncbi:MAG: hypothetical protein Fur0042_01950 [Cyanophyceae cyanobacterium]
MGSPLRRQLHRWSRILHTATWRSVAIAVVQRRLLGLSCEMAYNAMLAIFPGIIAILTAIGTLRPSEAVFWKLAERMSLLAPEQAMNLITAFVQEIRVPKENPFFSLGFLIALAIASSAIGAALHAMDEIHQIPQRQRRSFWRTKLVALALTVGTIALVAVASFLIFLSDWLLRLGLTQADVTLSKPILALWRTLTWPAALAIVAVAFGLLYRYGPSRWRRGTPLIPGAAVGALLWAATSAAFRLYVANFAYYNRIYGAVGAVIVLLLWLNLSSFALLVGAQVNVSLRQELSASSAAPPSP